MSVSYLSTLEESGREKVTRIESFTVEVRRFVCPVLDP